MAPASAFRGDPSGGSEDDKAARRAARNARFNLDLPGNRYKELEKLRVQQRKDALEQGLITSGQTQLGDAVDFRGTCEGMCSEFEIEFREFTREIHPFEALPNRRMDHTKAVAAYTRSDAGAGHGEAAKLPHDFRTPAALVRSLDYLINEILPVQPPPNPNAIHQPPPTQRRALGYSAGFIRDRTRAIRKEFAMQSSWGHEEAIASFERIARWHILCLRELQEETGSNTDMHIDSAELGRCFVSLRQHYNDRREELQTDLPCANEPEFRAYMLIFDLTQNSTSIPTAELPAVIMDHPLVQLAWQIRQAAQRNFDSQKEGQKSNSEYGSNMITRFVRLLKQQKVPYLLSCLVEIRLREMRRSAIRALTITYRPVKGDPVRTNELGQVIERKIVLIKTLDRLLGAEEQEEEGPAWDDIDSVSKDPDDESAAVVERFGLKIHAENGEIVGALINQAGGFNDNKDAPFTRRWKTITAKLGSAKYADVINGNAGVSVDGAAAQPVLVSSLRPSAATFRPSPALLAPSVQRTGGSAFSRPNGAVPSVPAPSAFDKQQGTSALSNGTTKSNSAFSFKPAPAFDFSKGSAASGSGKPEPIVKSAPPAPSTPTEPSAPASIPSFFQKPDSAQAAPKLPTAPPISTTPTIETSVPRTPTTIPNFFSSSTKQPEAGPSTTAPKSPFAFNIPAPTPPAPAVRHVSPPKPKTPPRPPSPKIPKIKLSYMDARLAGPTLRDRMVQEVVQSFLDENMPAFRAIIARIDAANTRAIEREERRAKIKRDAQLAYQAMVDDEVKVACWAETVLARMSRERARRAFQHWRQWAAESAEQHRQEELLREAELKRREALPLRSMNYSYGPGSSSRSTRSLSHASVMHYPMETDITEQLRETQRSADQLWRRGTFLNVVMDHVAPMLSRSTHLRHSTSFTSTPTWETVLLTAENSATPASEGSRGWLRDKLSPEHGRIASRRGIDFCLTSTDVHGEFPGSSDAGLFIFEAPRNTVLSQSQVERNAEDASDRLQAASSSAQQRSRYKSSLLLVSWDSETQEELIGRLGIAPDVELFDSVATISLEYPDTLEDLLRTALAELIPSDPCKERVIVPLDDAAVQLEEEWQRIVHMANILFREHGSSGTLAAAAVTAAVNVLSAVSGIVSDAIEPEPIGDEATYDLPKLPTLHLTDGDLDQVASQVVSYVSEPPLDSVQSIALAKSALRHISPSNSLPMLSILSALGSFVLGTLRQQTLPLDMWLPTSEAHEASHTIVTRITAGFHEAVNREIRTFSRAARDAKRAADAMAAATPLPPSPPKPKTKKGTKRRLEDDSESNASKAARRLRKLLAYHDKAFSEPQVV